MSPVPEDERDFEMEVEESFVVYVPPVQAIAQSVLTLHNVPDSIDLQNYRCAWHPYCLETRRKWNGWVLGECQFQGIDLLIRMMLQKWKQRKLRTKERDREKKKLKRARDKVKRQGVLLFNTSTDLLFTDTKGSLLCILLLFPLVWPIWPLVIGSSLLLPPLLLLLLPPLFLFPLLAKMIKNSGTVSLKTTCRNWTSNMMGRLENMYTFHSSFHIFHYNTYWSIQKDVRL